jgi:CubicO group peptidase (beta-lactamase class C family)
VTIFLNDWGIPGGSIAIVKDGRLVYARGFGYADKESSELVKQNHYIPELLISQLIPPTS